MTRLCEQLFGLIRKASMLRFSGSFCSHFLTFDVCFQKKKITASTELTLCCLLSKPKVELTNNPFFDCAKKFEI